MNWSVRNYFAAAMVVGATAAQAAVPYPNDATPKSVDRGLLRNLGDNSEVSVTVVLQLRDPSGAENLLTSLTTPGDPQFHKFLTPDQFRAKFGPAEADVRKVTSVLQRYGLSIERASSTTLRATGTPAKIENAFGVALHQFDVPAQGRAPAYSYRAPLEQPKVPEAVAGLVNAVVGFDTKPRFRPHTQQAPAALLGALQRGQKDSAKIVNPFGSLTVADFAQYYDVQPLYAAGVTGSGRTVGIVTLANFTPADAFGYWNSVGLKVDPGRIQIVNIDGGPGAECAGCVSQRRSEHRIYRRLHPE
jgi:kumamolisin